MKHKLHFSKLFLNDLDEIGDYITSEYSSTETALNIIKGIMDSVKPLSDFPNMGQVFFLPDGTDSGYRYVLYKKYITFYKIINDEVFIARVMYQKRDYIRVLFDEY